jgi:hypothetical protein
VSGEPAFPEFFDSKAKAARKQIIMAAEELVSSARFPSLTQSLVSESELFGGITEANLHLPVLPLQV